MLGFGAGGERRQALVIGNSAYAGAPLPAAMNDARAVAQALGELGFNVKLGVDLDFDATELLFAEFESDLSKEAAKVGLLYYSGHGVQFEGSNYLMPIGAESEAGADFAKLVSIEPLIDRMSKHVDTRLIVMDACRSNPFAQRLNVDVLRSKGYTKGFYVGENKTPIKPNGGLAEIRATVGTFIAFAAAPGGVAYEAPGETHSKFTAGLLRYIEDTDVPLGNLMIRVRNHVLQATNGLQDTWDYSSLRNPFFFNPGSLIMLVGNAIGLVGVTASLLPYSFNLAAYPHPDPHAALPAWCIPLSLAILVTSFALFMAGLQRAYQLLRGVFMDSLAAAPFGKGPEGFQVPWRRGLFGGFFGGIIAAPIITTAYYYAWKAAGWEDPLPPFGLLLTEITIASIIIGVLLGLLALFFAEYFNHLRAKSPSPPRIINAFTGAVLGGFIAGIICGPWTTLYFGLQDRPFVVPHILLLGAIPGTAVMIFAILNYTLEKVNLRRLARSGAASLGSVLIVGAVAGTLGWVMRDVIQGWADYVQHMADNVWHKWATILIAGFPYGIVIGLILGTVFGLTLVAMNSWERAPAK
jgi:hypothetical protein